MEADLTVDGVVCGLSCCDGPEDALLRGTDNVVAGIGIEASCGGTIEDMEADTTVDWVMYCLIGCCGIEEDPSSRGADDGSFGRVSYTTMSHIPSLLRNKLTFRFHGGASVSSPTLTCFSSLPCFGSMEHSR